MVAMIILMFIVFIAPIILLGALAFGGSPEGSPHVPGVSKCLVTGCPNVPVQGGRFFGLCGECQGHLNYYFSMSWEEREEFDKWRRENRRE